MRISSIIGHACELFETILAEPSFPVERQIVRYSRSRRYLGSRDRKQIRELIFDAVRSYHRFIPLLKLSPNYDSIQDHPSDLASVLIMAAALETGLLPEEPGMITDDVPFERAVKLVEALRTLDSESTDCVPSTLRGIQSGLPVWYLEAVEKGSGGGSAIDFRLYNSEAPVTLRANSLKISIEELSFRLKSEGLNPVPCHIAPDALQVDRTARLDKHPLFLEGLFEFQDEGSQVLSLIADVGTNNRVFDACAGGGGKSLHIAALQNNCGEIIAHDLDAGRLSQLKPRAARAGATSIRRLQHEDYLKSRERLAESFDLVMIDAPCSGSGTLRRSPGLLLTLSPERIREMVHVQRDVLMEYSRLVRPGGRLLYATCSIAREENEEIIEWFLENVQGWRRQSLQPDAPWSELISGEANEVRMFPHRFGMDGFYGALLMRTTT